jgi:hypothetical protein
MFGPPLFKIFFLSANRRCETIVVILYMYFNFVLRTISNLAYAIKNAPKLKQYFRWSPTKCREVKLDFAKTLLAGILEKTTYVPLHVPLRSVRH